MKLVYPDKSPVSRLADNVSITLIVLGFLVFFYGLITADQTLYIAMLSLQASLLGDSQEIVDLQIQEHTGRMPQELFALAFALLAAGIIIHAMRGGFQKFWKTN